MTRAFTKLIADLGLPKVRFHDLREGIHPKVVSERLGHSTVGITLDTYSHVTPSMQEEAAKRIDVALRSALRKRKPVWRRTSVWTSGVGTFILPRMEAVFDVDTPLGLRVHCTEAQWDLIATTKHPPMRGRIDQVKATLEDPDEIRRSVRDPEVLLFHRRADQRWYCAVARRTGSTGFLITAYPADKIKQGELLWTR